MAVGLDGAWIVTLLFTDQGVVMAPVILLLLPLWWALARGEGCADYGALWTTVRERLRSLRRDRALGLYAAGVVGVAVLDLVLRRISLPEAETPKLGLHALSSFADQMRFTAALGGQQHLSAYAAVAEAALVVLLLVPPLARARPDVARPLTTLVGLFGAASSVLSASVALIPPERPRAVPAPVIRALPVRGWKSWVCLRGATCACGSSWF
jgi:hypothetical protein